MPTTTEPNGLTTGGPSDAVALVVVGNQTYIPVGTTVAVGAPIAAPPEPFDPKRHILVRSALDSFNLVGKADFAPPPRFPGERRLSSDVGAGPVALSAPDPGDADKTLTLLQYSQQWYGVYQVNDAGTNTILPPRTANDTGYVYAPTLLPPGYSCIETTTVHLRKLNESTKHFQGWYDWCAPPSGAWYAFADITDQGFASHYVRTYLGKPTLTVSIVTPTTFNGCWYGHLYDYLLGGWIQTLASCTRPATHAPSFGNGLYGWSGWESYYVITSSNCVSLPAIRAMNIQYANPLTSQFQPVTDTPSDVSVSGSFSDCWYDPPTHPTGPYIFTFPGTAVGLPVNSWNGNTMPPPITVSIAGPNKVRPSIPCAWTANASTGTAPYSYTWTVNGLVVGTGSQVIYQNTGSAFTLTVNVTDAHGVGGTNAKSVTVTSSTPICTY